MSDLTHTLVWLCSIPSLTGQEEALCEAISERLRSSRPSLLQRRIGKSLVATLSTRDSGPRIVLAGHLDTVRTEHDGPVRIDGDRVYGLGASDMKSGLALMLELARVGVPENISVTLVFYAGEEGRYLENELETLLGSCQELGKERVDLAVCLEPSDNALQLGSMGTMHARVLFRGRTAHSARPWQGENAIYKAVPFLMEMAEVPTVEHAIQGLLFTEVMSVTMAQGGTLPNVVPGTFWMNVNYRFCPGTTVEQARQRIERLVCGRAEIEVVDAAPSAMPHREHWMVQALIDSGVRGVAPKQAWTDVARFTAHGIPAVNFGPGSQSQAHQPNEWASIALLQEGMSILQRWLCRIAETDTSRD